MISKKRNTRSKDRKQEREIKKRERRKKKGERKKETRINGSKTRKRSVRQMRDSFLIVCEGTKTEPNYFNSFELLKVDVFSIGIGESPQHIVEYAKRESRKNTYQQIWCVFDKDEFTNNEFNNAIESARALFLKNLDEKSRKYPELLGSAHSNEAFELWFLLHFQIHEEAISREDLRKLLTKHLGYNYEKNSLNMFEILKPHLKTAIKNSKKLWMEKSFLPQHNENPITAVHLLVQELMKHARP